MKLYLENFKCFEKAEFNFSDEKFQLLNASSGFGKTSIFEAIKFAFWGSKTTDIITFNKKKCKVVLEWKSLKITRTKNPNNIYIEKLDLNEKIQNPEEYIERYIPQYFFNFMNLKEDVQKKVIDKILNHDSVENLVCNLRRLIKEGNTSLKDNQIKLNTYQSSVDNLPKILEIIKPENILNAKDIEVMEKKLLSLEKIITSTNKSIGIYENVWKKLSNYENIDIDLFSKIKNDIENLENKKNNIIETNKEIFLLEEEIKKCKLNINKLDKKLAEIINVSEKFPSLTVEYLNLYRENVQKNSNINKEIDNLLKECKKYKEGKNINKIKKCIEESENNKSIFEYKCPSCKCSLILGESENSLKISPLNPDIGKLSEILKLLNNINNNYNKNTLEDLEFLSHNKTKYIDEKSNEEARMKKLEKSFKEKVEKKCNSLDEINLKLLDYRNILEKINQKIYFQNELMKFDINLLKNNLSKCLEEKENLEKAIKEYMIKSKEFCLWEQNENLKNTKKEFCENIEKINKNIDKISHTVQRMEKIKHTIQESYMISIQSFIDELNELLIFFTESFFPENNISIQADIIKENMTGKAAKFQLDFKIFHNGILTRPNTLSSGEMARVNLAIDLSMYKLLNSTAPLLLDEVTSNLDTNISTKIFKNINYSIDNDIFVIAHQATEGIFQNVYNEDFLSENVKFSR